MASTKDNIDFANSVIDTESLLDDAIRYIQSNLSPDDVFSTSDLEDWAIGEGWVKGDD